MNSIIPAVPAERAHLKEAWSPPWIVSRCFQTVCTAWVPVAAEHPLRPHVQQHDRTPRHRDDLQPVQEGKQAAAPAPYGDLQRAGSPDEAQEGQRQYGKLAHQQVPPGRPVLAEQPEPDGVDGRGGVPEDDDARPDVRPDATEPAAASTTSRALDPPYGLPPTRLPRTVAPLTEAGTLEMPER